MRIRITTSVSFRDGPSISPGTVVDWPESQAKDWIRAGKAVPAEVETTSAVPKRETAAKVGLTKHAKGGGWWEIRRGGEAVEKVQGEDDADAYIAKHG